VPYSTPMFDVPDVSRFYRCSITDVHIGRSLIHRAGPVYSLVLSVLGVKTPVSGYTAWSN